MALAEETRPSPVVATAPSSRLDTLPKLLLDHAARRGTRPAIREKDYGIWQGWSWAEQAHQIEALARGLAALGFRRGDRLAVIGDNRPRLYWAMTAAQCLGGIPVPVYQDAVAEELRFVLDHAEARFAIVEDQEQADKIIAVKDRLPGLETVIYDDPRGLRHYRQPYLHAYDEIERAEGGDIAGEIARGRGSDIAVMLYTSGTTGQPKGVMLTYDNVLSMVRAAVAHDSLTDADEVLSYLPMAWVGDYVFSLAQSYVTGFCMSCPESGATVMSDLREIGPTYFFAPPRIFETILTQVMVRIEDAARPKRALFHGAMALARRVGEKLLDGEPVGLMDRVLYRLGELFVYGPLKNTLGLSRVRVAYTAGEAIGPDLFRFFRGLGINIKQLYGMTEATVFVCMQRDGAVKADTVGPPLAGVELRVADDGEVMFRSPGVFAGYYKNEAATAETKRPDGWVHTGDAGFIGDDGQLRIVDRAKDVGRLADGTLFAPKFIENKLKFFAQIKEAVAVGDGRAHVAALINIDATAVGNWAERKGIPWGSYQELASLDSVAELVRGCVAAVNRDLAAEPHLAGAQIRRFLLLPKELDADDGELTRTRKVRRRFIAERYATMIEALYDGSKTVDVETEITFEDGRKGRMKATLAIHDLAP